ncbi:Sortilin-related receptor [Eumeta japonica]|uniref:Sortilin-related receptor n=1 Tax=Eumeta variegata TaxID=151549 RepID=A0A4C1SEY3_EUMVA|nr:Sortilin-related receptor [Eumeta japonica]
MGTAAEDLYWEGEEELSNEFLEVNEEEYGSALGSLIRKKREFGFFNPFSWPSSTTTSSTTASPTRVSIGDSDDDGYAEDYEKCVTSAYRDEDDNGSGFVPTEKDKEQTIRVSFVAFEPYLEDYSNRDSEKFQELSHNLADSVNALYESLPGTQRASLVRIQSRISDNFSCKVTLDIATTGYYNKDKIISVLRDHIHSNRALGTTSVNDNDFSARLIDSENIPGLLPQCLNDDVLCDNGQCVAGSARCDGNNDCGDGSDELDCPEVTPTPVVCYADQLQCNNGQCISIDLRCNGVSDCPDGFDEENCFGRDDASDFQTDEPIEHTTNSDETDEEFYQPDSRSPISVANNTDPRSRGFDCDETFFCEDGIELCSNKKCDGKQDCSDADDEKNCSSETLGSQVVCAGCWSELYYPPYPLNFIQLQIKGMKGRATRPSVRCLHSRRIRAQPGNAKGTMSGVTTRGAFRSRRSATVAPTATMGLMKRTAQLVRVRFRGREVIYADHMKLHKIEKMDFFSSRCDLFVIISAEKRLKNAIGRSNLPTKTVLPHRLANTGLVP